jgi:hypothetical protein
MNTVRFSALFAFVLIACIGSLQAAPPPTRIISPITIMVSGSYVLANDINGGIIIQVSDVTLFLVAAFGKREKAGLQPVTWDEYHNHGMHM